MNPFKNWRESASLILAAKSSFSPPKAREKFDYKLLMLKRSSKSRFMPGTYVYPGGNISDADSSKGWFKLYDSFGIRRESLEKLNIRNEPNVILDGRFPSYLSLRITAIRETFEECGILICRSYRIKYDEEESKWGSFIGGSEIKKWQSKVHNNPDDFLNLCLHFDVYPDIWALKEWSNWYTPTTFPTRFNTMFYLVAFHELPAIQAEETEVQMLVWATPDELIMKNKQEEIILPPPQFYETSRMLNFNKLENLAHFSHERATKGVEKFFPYRIDTNDGTVSILPGDSLYPKEINTTNCDTPFSDKVEETNIMHRIFHKSFFHQKVILRNYQPNNGHVLPLELNLNKL